MTPILSIDSIWAENYFSEGLTKVLQDLTPPINSH